MGVGQALVGPNHNSQLPMEAMTGITCELPLERGTCSTHGQSGQTCQIIKTPRSHTGIDGKYTPASLPTPPSVVQLRGLPGPPKDSVLVAHNGDFNMPSIGFWVLPVSLAPSPVVDSYSCLPVLTICWGDPNEGRDAAGDSKRSLCKRWLLSQRGPSYPSVRGSYILKSIYCVSPGALRNRDQDRIRYARFLL